MPRPIAKPAGEMLQPPGQTAIAWAVFDAAWYLARYPDVRSAIGDAGDSGGLSFYLEQGQKLGHSPNIWFDETWYVRQNADVAAAVRDGRAHSGFDAYCLGFFYHTSPHWLFNEAYYRQQYDLTDEVLANDSAANGYDHYLRYGCKEDRIGHRLFDPATYRAQLDPAERAAADAAGTFIHYLRHIEARGPELPVSPYFSATWYLRRYPTVAETVAKGDWLCALHHYLANDAPAKFDPLEEFSESYYLSRHPDVATMTGPNSWRNGYEHFLADGAVELRAPHEQIDLRNYANAHRSVRADLAAGLTRDAFTHYLTIGRNQGLALCSEQEITEQQANALFLQTATDRLPTASRARHDFTCDGPPSFSVVMVLSNAFELTLLALAGLRANHSGPIELILVDNGSTDETTTLNRYVEGARRLRFDVDIGFVRACNAALNCVTSDIVLFLSNAAALMPGAIAAALSRLGSDVRIGAVGGKLVRGHGRLLQAGGIVWRDGMVCDYLSDASPTAPEANFVRDVDFCSSDFLLVRAALLRELEGFDDELADREYESADLCMRIAGAGQRVVYDPAVVVYCHDERSNGFATGGTIESAHQRFSRKHARALRFRYIADRHVAVFARCADTNKRVLFIDDTIPMRMIGSGFVRSTDIIQTMASLGYSVTIYPINRSSFGLADVYADMPDTAEVIHDGEFATLAEFLTARRGYYDAIWIARTHNLDRVKPLLERMAGVTRRLPRIVLDTEAITSLRDAARTTLTGEKPVDVDTAITREFANATICQNIIAVNPDEARSVRELGFSNVTVLGHLREAQPTPRAFTERAGLLFIGGMHHPDSPNYDGLVWFIEMVLPLIESALGWETRLTVVGYTGVDVSLAQFRDHPRVTLRGPLVETERLYDAHRIFVAPTRFAAGTPYKVHEAASFGIPVVATELLRRQLGWENSSDLLSAEPDDPAEFARHVVTLYRDASLWQRLRDNALERIRKENNRAQYEAVIRQVLQG
jgi:GT2 family glycosyltransferase